jgi:hypothetical protein
VHNGKGVKEREGDDFYPQQRQHRHRLVMSAMGQVPVLILLKNPSATF